MTKSMQCIVKGKVQGVMFRAWVHDHAKNLGLKGWVRNIQDGTVEVLMQGDESSMAELKKRLLTGSPLSHVDDLKCDFIDYDKAYDDFEIRG
jgi:acylphosphatase